MLFQTPYDPFVVSVKHIYRKLVFHAGTEAYKLKKRCKTTIKKYHKHEKSDH